MAAMTVQFNFMECYQEGKQKKLQEAHDNSIDTKNLLDQKEMYLKTLISCI